MYGVENFVADLRRAASAGAEAAIVGKVKPLLQRLAQSSSWRNPAQYECDPQQGFGMHVLHEEPDHSLWLVAVSWLPHRGPPPHNHGTWAVIAGIEGVEKNILWRRRGERLERQGEETIGPGQVSAFLGSAIHSVVNEGDQVTLSLHAYGRNLNLVERRQFDPQTGAAKAYKVKVQ
jgi:predicted metal-dependent enzyme (double-stranded beta helix superfamily)